MIMYTSCRRQVSSVQASDVVLMDIMASGMNGVEFSMFVVTSDSNAVLDQQALLQAVQVSIFIIIVSCMIRLRCACSEF